MKAMAGSLALMMVLMLALMGCSDSVTGPEIGDGGNNGGSNGGGGGNGGSGGGGGGGGGASPQAAVNFPLHPGSQWHYQAQMQRRGDVYMGEFTATVTSFNLSARVGRIDITGDRTYDNIEEIPRTIYLRDTDDGLERAESSSGPWHTVYEKNTGSWSNGWFIFAGTPGKTTQLSAGQVSVPAGDFQSIHVKAHYDNRGQQYAMEIFDNDWVEDIHPTLGLLKTYRYSYYHNKDPQWPLPMTSIFTVELAGYNIMMPDGSNVSGGTGVQVELGVTMVPQTSDFQVIEDILYVVDGDLVPVLLTFTKAMDRQSVEQAFKVEYWEGTTLKTMDGYWDWQAENRAAWNPSDRYIAGVPYMMSLGTSARATDCETLPERADMQLRYEP